MESALVAHAKVSESAVVGFPHPIKGQGIYAYVTLMAGETPSDELRQELVAWVRKEIGPIASPDVIQFSPTLPKTRSGKIMRRILRKIAEDDFSNLGDISTLADPTVVTDLVNNRQNKKAAPGDATPPQQPAAKGQASPAPPKEPPLSERPAAKQESGGLLKRLFGG